MGFYRNRSSQTNSNLLSALFCICLHQYWVKFICIMPWWPISFERLKEKLISWNMLLVCISSCDSYCLRSMHTLLRLNIANKSLKPIVNSGKNEGESKWKNERNVRRWTNNRYQTMHGRRLHMWEEKQRENIKTRTSLIWWRTCTFITRKPKQLQMHLDLVNAISNKRWCEIQSFELQTIQI